MIGIHGLSFRYPGQRLLFRELAVSFPEGCVTALAGPNGTGKSTLLKLAAGLLEPSEGTVVLEGDAIAKVAPLCRARKVAFVPQFPLLPSDWTVREVVEAGNYPYEERPPEPSPLEARLATARVALGLDACWERPAGQVSGGEAQRAALARALVQETEVLLLDEPCSHQDLRRQVNLFSLLQALSRRGKTVVVTTHDVNLPRQFGFDLLLLDREGRVHTMPTETEAQRSLLESVYQTPMACSLLADIPCWFPSAGGISTKPLHETTPCTQGDKR